MEEEGILEHLVEYIRGKKRSISTNIDSVGISKKNGHGENWTRISRGE
jgi:hypothetical protein